MTLDYLRQSFCSNPTAPLRSGGYGAVPSEDPELELVVENATTPPDAKEEEKLKFMNDLKESQSQAEEAKQRFEVWSKFWEQKKEKLQLEISLLEAQVKDHETRLHYLDGEEQPKDEEPEVEPPGPPYLKFVQGTAFTLLSAGVVVVNIGTMIAEMLHPHYKEKLYYFDQLVLIFYIVEIVLKGALLHSELLFGAIGQVWWNWLDLVIVLVAIADQWVKPLLESAGMLQDTQGGQALQIIKMLRLARLARILKMVRAFLASDLSWAEGQFFQLFIMGVIAFNSFMMSFESDYPEFPGWFYLEQLLLVIFSFELAVRLRHWGLRFFYHKDDFVWNWLDFIIVVGGIIDQWLMPGVAIVKTLMGMKAGGQNSMGQVMMMLRLARLLRILRLVRLVKSIPPLFTLITGIVKAMQGMTWVVVLTTVFLYAFALLSVRLIGHGLVPLGDDKDREEEVMSIFGSVPEAMFVWFEAMNGNSDLLKPLFRVMPIAKFVYILWMVTSSWAILSILTAVVSENMIKATEDHRQEQEEEQIKRNQEASRDIIEKLFKEADKDNNGTLDKSEFQAILADPDMKRDLVEAAGVEEGDLEELFELLSTNEEEDGANRFIQRITHKDFILGLQTESRAMTERSMMRMEKRMVDLSKALDRWFRCQENEEETIERRIGKLSEQMQASSKSAIEDVLPEVMSRSGIQKVGLDLQGLTAKLAETSKLESRLEPLVRAFELQTEQGSVGSDLTRRALQPDRQVNVSTTEPPNNSIEAFLLTLEQRFDACSEKVVEAILSKFDSFAQISTSVGDSLMSNVLDRLDSITSDFAMESLVAKFEKRLDTMMGGSSHEPFVGMRANCLKGVSAESPIDTAIESMLAKLEKCLDTSRVASGTVSPTRGPPENILVADVTASRIDERSTSQHKRPLPDFHQSLLQSNAGERYAAAEEDGAPPQPDLHKGHPLSSASERVVTYEEKRPSPRPEKRQSFLLSSASERYGATEEKKPSPQPDVHPSFLLPSASERYSNTEDQKASSQPEIRPSYLQPNASERYGTTEDQKPSPQPDFRLSFLLSGASERYGATEDQKPSPQPDLRPNFLLSSTSERHGTTEDQKPSPQPDFRQSCVMPIAGERRGSKGENRISPQREFHQSSLLSSATERYSDNEERGLHELVKSLGSSPSRNVESSAHSTRSGPADEAGSPASPASIGAPSRDTAATQRRPSIPGSLHGTHVPPSALLAAATAAANAEAPLWTNPRAPLIPLPHLRNGGDD